MRNPSETRTIYIEEFQFGVDQLHALLMLTKLLQASRPEAITPEAVAGFAEHASNLIATSLEALNCFAPD